MIKKTIEWYDLDGVLWHTGAKWWVIDKNEPNIPIIKITQEEGYLCTNYVYLKDDLKIFYNGIEGYLSKDIFSKIQKVKKIELEDLGLSFREYNDISFLTKQSENMIILFKNIEHLHNHDENTTIALLTAHGNKKGHDILLTKLKDTLKDNKLNINIDKIYFINDEDTLRHVGSTPEKKALIILEHIIGYRIKKFNFIDTIQEKYDKSILYDDESANIEQLKNINVLLQKILGNTKKSNLNLYNKIIKYIKDNKKNIIIETNLVTTNTVNPFITTNIDLNI